MRIKIKRILNRKCDIISFVPRERWRTHFDDEWIQNPEKELHAHILNYSTHLIEN